MEILGRPNARIAVNRNSASKLAKALKKLELKKSILLLWCKSWALYVTISVANGREKSWALCVTLLVAGGRGKSWALSVTLFEIQ